MTAAAEESLVELRFPARPHCMAMVRPSIRSAARYCGFDEPATHDIVLAVSEACQNVILHAYAGHETGDIVLRILRRKDGIVLRVTDFAPSIDTAAVKPRHLDDLRPGGLGTHFIRELMDSADFLPGPDGVGNILQMIKTTEAKK